MKNSLLNLVGPAVVSLIFLAGANHSAQAADAHDKFKVLDLKIGMPLKSAKGFTCTKERWTQSRVRIEPVCVRFVDKRCKGKPQSIGSLRYGETSPKGCYFDLSGRATRLDNILMQDPHSGAGDQPRNGRKPLNNVTVYGTKHESSRIYRIEYMLDEDNLQSTDSKIYKALVAKYGEPTYPEHSGKVTWKADGTELVAYCEPYHGCRITVYDRNFENLENTEQEEADKKKKSDSAPTPNL